MEDYIEYSRDLWIDGEYGSEEDVPAEEEIIYLEDNYGVCRIYREENCR